jgi:Protein of unknown function (DUF1579)
MKLSKFVALVTSCLLTAAAAQAQEKKMEMPKPGPEHKKLGYFVGKWHSEGDMKPSAFGPGGKMTGDDECSWAQGGFFVACHGTGTGPMGKMTSLGMLGYDTAGKVYTYNGFNSMGENEHATGTVEGKTWSYTNESMVNGKMMKGRYTIVEGGPDSYAFKYEGSEDGKTWNAIMEGKVTKK